MVPSAEMVARPMPQACVGASELFIPTRLQVGSLGECKSRP